MLGSLFGMIKGPADFFVRCYRTYGPVCRLSIPGEQYESIKGRYDELVSITDGALSCDWHIGKEVHVVESMRAR